MPSNWLFDSQQAVQRYDLQANQLTARSGEVAGAGIAKGMENAVHAFQRQQAFNIKQQQLEITQMNALRLQQVREGQIRIRAAELMQEQAEHEFKKTQEKTKHIHAVMEQMGRGALRKVIQRSDGKYVRLNLAEYPPRMDVLSDEDVATYKAEVAAAPQLMKSNVEPEVTGPPRTLPDKQFLTEEEAASGGLTGVPKPPEGYDQYIENPELRAVMARIGKARRHPKFQSYTTEQLLRLALQAEGIELSRGR